MTTELAALPWRDPCSTPAVASPQDSGGRAALEHPWLSEWQRQSARADHATGSSEDGRDDRADALAPSGAVALMAPASWPAAMVLALLSTPPEAVAEPAPPVHDPVPAESPHAQRQTLSVMLAQGHAQVAVRDAQLSPQAAEASSGAIARQLLGTALQPGNGLQTVRVYINGSERLYRLAAEGPGPATLSPPPEPPENP